MGHSIKIAKYNCKYMCNRCGELFETAEEGTKHMSATGHQRSIIEVDEKIADAVSILTKKGYHISKSSQGGWPDYYEEILEDGKIGQRITKHPEKDVMPRFHMYFAMAPSSLKQFKRQLTDEEVQNYSSHYWEIIGTMIDTLPNAFNANIKFEIGKDTLPRSIIRTPKLRTRNLVINWIPWLSYGRLESEEEVETMKEYSYKKLKEWAEALPDINKYFNSEASE